MPKSRINYKNVEDDELLSIIKGIIHARHSYGYRRVTALINRKLITEEKPKINHKRIYRIMKRNNLLLPKFDKKQTRVHDGKIITLKSNTRWCSDAFTIQCDNGDRVHIAFSLDTCDREVLGYVASTIGMDGAAIRDLMFESVEYRFGKVTRLPHQIQWLSDNGPCYVSRQTVSFARHLGFDVCTTPAYSPESNGMAEAFVKTFKRDYVAFGDLQSSFVVMKQLAAWFYDYNENAPHKGLKMLAPRQFLKQTMNN